ncbi:MAG: MBL fold metallo-hydrolase [Candidatus Saccharibacteria bacterium]
MFEIEYKGANCVVISTKKAKIVVDPKLSIVGQKDISTNGFVELLTESRFSTNNTDQIIVIDGPGEYGIAEFDILGLPVRRHIDTESDGFKSTMYRIEVGDTRIAVIGNIHNKLLDEQLEELGLIDILIIPVGGGGYTLDSTTASSIVRMINPKVVIPVHYYDKSLKYEVQQDELQLFITELGAPVEVVSKYKYKQSSLVQSQLSIVEITRT